ncbi:N-acetyltransferase family protein [Campylobacterota bacterium DY0563]
MIECRLAKLEDIEQILKLHARYQVDTINEDDKKDGFITTSFSKEQLTALIEDEQGLFVALKDDEIVAYVMAASWAYWSAWPMFVHMIKELPNIKFQGETLSVDNSYQYGPVCVDKSVRGTDVLKLIFDFARKEMNKRYPILVTFINKINPRSYEAHTRKLGLEVVNEFEFNNNQYYELCYDTSKVL